MNQILAKEFMNRIEEVHSTNENKEDVLSKSLEIIRQYRFPLNNMEFISKTHFQKFKGTYNTLVKFARYDKNHTINNLYLKIQEKMNKKNLNVIYVLANIETNISKSKQKYVPNNNEVTDLTIFDVYKSLNMKIDETGVDAIVLLFYNTIDDILNIPSIIDYVVIYNSQLYIENNKFPALTISEYRYLGEENLSIEKISVTVKQSTMNRRIYLNKNLNYGKVDGHVITSDKRNLYVESKKITDVIGHELFQVLYEIVILQDMLELINKKYKTYERNPNFTMNNTVFIDKNIKNHLFHENKKEIKKTLSPSLIKLESMINMEKKNRDVSIHNRNNSTSHISHASPHEHFRKEHMRHYKSGKIIKIKSTVVNRGNKPQMFSYNKSMSL